MLSETVSISGKDHLTYFIHKTTLRVKTCSFNLCDSYLLKSITHSLMMDLFQTPRLHVPVRNPSNSGNKPPFFRIRIWVMGTFKTKEHQSACIQHLDWQSFVGRIRVKLFLSSWFQCIFWCFKLCFLSDLLQLQLECIIFN